MTRETLATPDTPVELAEVEYGDHIVWRLTGATITCFGANAAGEIFLQAEKDGKFTEVIIGKDERGDIALFEAEAVPVEAKA